MSKGFTIRRINATSAGVNIVNTIGFGEIHNTPNEEIWSSSNSDSFTVGKGSSRPISTGLTGPATLSISLMIPGTSGEALSDTQVTIAAVDAESGTSVVASSSVGGSVVPASGAEQQALLPVKVSFRPQWAQDNFPWGYKGNVKWTITSSTYGTSTCNTILEVYGITQNLGFFWGSRIDVRFLRTFILPARPSRTGGKWTKYVAESAFHDFKFKYEIERGAPGFNVGQNGGEFHLSRWTQSASRHLGTTVNCFDQAAIAQIALDLGGVPSDWLFVQPFGFLRGLTLIGFPGQTCNSPYRGDIPVTGNWYLRNNEDPDREMFHNHAFLRVEKKYAVDACGGPVGGDVLVEDYLTQTIQPKSATNAAVGGGPQVTLTQPTSLYWRKEGDRQNVGTYAGIGGKSLGKQLGNGVWGIDGCTILDPNPDPENAPVFSKDVNDTMDAAQKNFNGTGLSPINIYWFDLGDLDHAIRGWGNAVGASDITGYVWANNFGFTMIWDIDVPTVEFPDVSIEMNFLRKHDDAMATYKRMLNNGRVFTGGVMALDNNPSNTISQRISLTSNAEGRGLLFWMRGNIVIKMTGHVSNSNLMKQFGQPLDTWISQYLAKGNPPTLPLPTPSLSPTSKLTPGSTFNISITIPTGLSPIATNGVSWLDTAPDGDIFHPNANNDALMHTTNLDQVVRSDPGTNVWNFKFKAGTRLGAHVLRFFYVDKVTAQSTTVEVKYEIVAAASA